MSLRMAAPGGTFETAGEWKTPDGKRIMRRIWPSQAEQVLYLRGVVDTYRGTQTIRNHAIDVVFRQYGCRPKDKRCHALAIGDWWQKNCLYVEEMPERFITPIQMLIADPRAGDCDDFTAAIASDGEAIGIPSRLRAAWWKGGYRHIWPELFAGGEWIKLDATLNGPVGLTDPLKILIRKHGDDARILTL